jgi:hypothetical protein
MSVQKIIQNPESKDSDREELLRNPFPAAAALASGVVGTRTVGYYLKLYEQMRSTSRYWANN